MKRFISICLAVIFAVAVTLPAEARETVIADTESQLQINEQFGFEFESKVVAQERIVNTFKGESVKDRLQKVSSDSIVWTEDIYSATQSLLRDMGMGDSFIEALSHDDLKMYSESDYIVSITTTFSENGVMRSNDLNASNAYYTLTMFISHIEQGVYRCSVDVDWFDEPSYEGDDIIGISATDCSPRPSTFSGWYSYRKNNSTSVVVDFTSNEFHVASAGGWSGGAAKFDLNDAISSDLDIHFQYDCEITSNDLVVYFDVAGSYDHSKNYMHNLTGGNSVAIKNRNGVYVIEAEGDKYADLLFVVQEDILYMSN